MQGEDGKTDDATTITVGKEDGNVNVNLNDKNIIGNDEGPVIEVEEGGNLTITGGDAKPDEAAKPDEERKNTIEGDVDNSGDLTVDKATVDGSVENSNKFTLTDSVVTGDVANTTNLQDNTRPYKNNNSTVKGTTSWNLGGTQWSLERTKDSDGYRMVVGANSTPGSFGAGFVSWINTMASEAGISVDKITEIEFGSGITDLGMFNHLGEENFPNLTSVTIQGSGDTVVNSSTFLNCNKLTSVTLGPGVKTIDQFTFSSLKNLTSVTIQGDGKTEIGYGAFHKLSSLKSVTLGSGVKTIGESAFSGCTGLTSVTIPESVTSIKQYAFSGCTGLTSVTIPGSVTSIGGNVFNGCTGLESVTLGEGVTSIGQGMFSGLTSLTSVEIPKSVKTIGSWAFKDCTGLESVTIPESVKTIEEYAFSGCTNLKNVTINGGAEKIGESVFSGCTGLTDVTIGGSVTSIKDWMFQNCTGLESVTIGGSVKTIGNNAFSGCTGLTSVEIPNSVEAIGDNAFSGCKGLTSVEIPKSVETIGYNAFNGCTNLTNVTINGDVKSIGFGAFSGCTDLNVTIGDGVKTIGNNAFQNYTGLKSVTIPDSVETIGYNAFSGCTGLTSVKIPSGVTTISGGAFQGCTGLTSVTIPDSVSIQSGAFDGAGLKYVSRTDNNGKVTTVAYYPNGIKGSDWTGGFIPSDGAVVAVKSADGSTPAITVDESGNGTIQIPAGSTVTAGTFEFNDPNGQTVEIKNNEITIAVPAGTQVKVGYGTETTYPDGATVDQKGKITTNGSTITYEYGDVIIKDSEGKTIKAFDIWYGQAKVNPDGTTVVPAGASVCDLSDDTTDLELLSDGMIDKNGNVISCVVNVIKYDDDWDPIDETMAVFDQAGNKTVITGKDTEEPTAEKNEDGSFTVTIPEGGTVGGTEWPLGGTITIGKDGTVTIKQTLPPIIDVPLGEDPTVEVDDPDVPLAEGPVTCAQFVDYLWRHEGSPEAEGDLFTDHEYAPAIAWALSVGIIDEGFQPDEIIDGADVKAILGNFANVVGTNAVPAGALTTLVGDDDEAVMNCGEVLAEFFGEEYLPAQEEDIEIAA